MEVLDADPDDNIHHRTNESRRLPLAVEIAQHTPNETVEGKKNLNKIVYPAWMYVWVCVR